MSHRIFLLLIFIAAATLTQAQEKEIRQKLVGDWIYVDLAFPEPMSENDKKNKETANTRNANLIVSFLEDGSYIIWNKLEGKKVPYAKGELELTKKGKHLKIETLEGDIEKINAEELRLTGPKKPVMVFKRYKS